MDLQTAEISQLVAKMLQDVRDTNSAGLAPTLPCAKRPFHPPEIQWTLDEDHRLKQVLARIITLQPIPWCHVAQEFPRKPLAEVFKRINNCLKDIQNDILTQAVQVSAAAPNRDQLIDPSPTQAKRKIRTPPSEEQALKKRKLPMRWSEEDKRKFHLGVDEHGWGNWKTIAETYLPNKTVPQITSHGQKFLNKIRSTLLKKRSGTGNDISDDVSGQYEEVRDNEEHPSGLIYRKYII